MAQWSVHRNLNPSSRGEVPYLLDVQADLLAPLGTRVVVPLFKKAAAPPELLTRLTPSLRVRGETLVLMTPRLAGVRTKDLGEQVTDLSGKRAEILAALDLLLTGV